MVNNKLESLPEEELIFLCKQGNKQAFEVIYMRYFPPLFTFASKIIRSKLDAEELVNNVFTNVWQRREKLDSQRPIKPYLYKSVRNQSLNYLRQTQWEVLVEHVIDTHPGHSSTEDEVIYADYEQHYRHAIDLLSPQKRQVFCLSRDEGLSYKEIAGTLNISEKTVEMHVRLSLQSIKYYLREVTGIL